MATTVYTVEEIELQDENRVILKPLVVKGLRHFMKMLKEMGTVEDEDDAVDVLINIAAFCLSKQHPHYWNPDKDNGMYIDPDDEEKKKKIERLKGGYTEAFEEAVDMPTVYRIIEVCGGVNLNDPNLMRAAAAAAEAAAEDGKN